MKLTIDNVYDLLESTEYTIENLQSKTNLIEIYNHLTELLLNNFFPEYVVIENFEQSFCNSVKLLEPHNPSIYQDVTLLTIKRFYPTTIYKLNDITDKEGDTSSIFSEPLIWNINEYKILFNFLLKNIDNFKEMSKDGRVILMIRFIINFTFGIAISGKNRIKCYNPSLIIDTNNKMYEIIQNKFYYYLIYCDVDEFYFSDFNDKLPELKGMLDNWGYSYEIEKINYFFYLAKKKFIISDNPFEGKGLPTCIKSLKEYKELGMKIKWM